MNYIKTLSQISKKSTAKVGGKSANLGELYNKVKVKIPPAFFITADAYWHYVRKNKLDRIMRKNLKGLDTGNLKALAEAGKNIRNAFVNAEVPINLRKQILKAYNEMRRKLKIENLYVAVRSSATAEDLPGASFAGQQETYLNVLGEEALMEAVKKCFASLFTDRAISYRGDKGFSSLKVALSIAVQEMVRSDIGASGVIFTIDPDSGFRNVVIINGAYGLGEYIVQGKVTPDEWMIFKPTRAIIEKTAGNKARMMVRSKQGHVNKVVPASKRRKFCLNDKQVLELAEYAMRIDSHYKAPMDIEWALDGETKEIYIVQARPETVHAVRKTNIIEDYMMVDKAQPVLKGMAIGKKIITGKVKVIRNVNEINQFRAGEILVTTMTDPDWEPIMKIASGIITDEGGRTSHAAIVSRELGVPAVVGTQKATKLLRTNDFVTLDCSSEEGSIYKGKLKFKILKKDLTKLPKTRTQVLVNIGQPDLAFTLAQTPVQGVGLAREEFIISAYVNAHPLYLIKTRQEGKFINALTTGIAKICAAFYPRPVLVRLSDFKSDEYANLKGGREFEPVESNPMIGWRGASRYYDAGFKKAFEIECLALKKVYYDMKLKNMQIMVPFCRTVEEGKKVLKELEKFKLGRKHGVKVFVMAEIPSNIILAEDFAKIFDGFSIGSNDLTQLTLGLDRNSEKLSYLFDERNQAVKDSISFLINKAHKYKRKVGICGQAPSDYPDFAKFLVENKIDSISVNPDVVLDTILLVAKCEKELERKKKKH